MKAPVHPNPTNKQLARPQCPYCPGKECYCPAHLVVLGSIDIEMEEALILQE